MARITTEYQPETDLTTFIATGSLEYKDILDKGREFLSGCPSKLVLWDFSAGSLAPFSNKDFRSLAHRAGNFSPKIAGAKAAIMAPEAIDFGLGRMFQVYSEMENFPYQVQIFRDLESAKSWLFPD